MEVEMSLDMQKAYDAAGFHLNECAFKNNYKIPEDFTFIKMRQASFAYFDLCFRYKNQVFAILLDIKHNNSSIFENNSEREEDFIEFCEENNLIPCLFPLNLSFDKENRGHSYGTYITGGHVSSQIFFTPYNTNNWNLIHAITKENVNPSELATDTPIPMSKYEQYNFATEIAKQMVEKWFGQIVEWNDVPGDGPQLVYLEKGHKDSKAWCCVLVVDKPIEDIVEEILAPIFIRNGIFVLVHIKNTNRTNLRHTYEYKVREIDNYVLK